MVRTFCVFKHTAAAP
jgi:hypothetical protein